MSVSRIIAASLKLAGQSFGSNCNKRSISTISTAKRLLGFSQAYKPTMQELRKAYFEAAKRTHPDMVQKNEEGMGFREVTEAYEQLLSSKEVETSPDLGITQEEEELYRQACTQVLGISADIVEESKRNPMFRLWLGGNTDGAQHWRAFFAVHGGLAQKIRPPSGYLNAGAETPRFETRRPRKR
jgi:curved DNA-binding protein CbpA